VKWITRIIGITFAVFTVWGLIELLRQTGDEPMPWQLGVVFCAVAVSFVAVAISYIAPARKQILKKLRRQR